MASVLRFDNWETTLGTGVVSTDGSGNVAVGSSSPSYKLDVTGDINATGNLRVAGNAVGDYSTFTPVWTATTTNPAIGNGVMNGRLVRINDLVIAQYEIRPGSTTTFGTGFWKFDYPVTYDPTGFFAFADIGFGRAYDANVATVYNMHAVVDNASTTTFRLSADSTGSAPSSTAPFTWTVGDELLFTIVYKAA